MNFFIYPSLILFCVSGIPNLSFDLDKIASFQFLGALPLAILLHRNLSCKNVVTTSRTRPVRDSCEIVSSVLASKHSYSMRTFHFRILRFTFSMPCRTMWTRVDARTVWAPCFVIPVPVTALLIELLRAHERAANFLLVGFYLGQFSHLSALENRINALKSRFEPHRSVPVAGSR